MTTAEQLLKHCKAVCEVSIFRDPKPLEDALEEIQKILNEINLDHSIDDNAPIEWVRSLVWTTRKAWEEGR